MNPAKIQRNVKWKHLVNYKMWLITRRATVGNTLLNRDKKIKLFDIRDVRLELLLVFLEKGMRHWLQIVHWPLILLGTIKQHDKGIKSHQFPTCCQTSFFWHTNSSRIINQRNPLYRDNFTLKFKKMKKKKEFQPVITIHDVIVL